ncbi:MAG: glycosyltransferase family 4 protein [Gammaproteobacteria bacterium]|nr:glycosyltransferase family 4 protein [Gammaproteobacteria bacterium]
MRLAFCLFRYFPFGGLQRDFMRIAQECIKRGHIVDVYTMSWEGEFEPGLAIRTLKVKGLSNHSRREDFVRQLQPFLQQNHYDLVVGFNKMPGLDVYYAADICYQAKARTARRWWYRLTQRYRHNIDYEKAVFSVAAKTDILLIAKKQQAEFQHYYHTEDKRFHLLPPGIDKDRKAPANAKAIQEKVREAHAIGKNDFLLLMVGSGFKTKGVDRTLLAYAALPPHLKKRSRVMIIGNDNAKPFERQAKQLGILENIIFLGGRKDVPDFLLAADLLLHPAYHENTGTVLLEAVVAGLPVLTTDVCGYASYIHNANAGVVLPSPFKQEQFNQTLVDMLSSEERDVWHRNGLEYANHADIYSMPERAVLIIESLR